jgi:hypothetical protein
MEPENREQREAYEKKEIRSLLSGRTIGTKANNNEELVTNGYLECDQEYMAKHCASDSELKRANSLGDEVSKCNVLVSKKVNQMAYSQLTYDHYLQGNGNGTNKKNYKNVIYTDSSKPSHSVFFPAHYY